MTNFPRYSVVVPVFNSAGTLQRLCERTHEFFQKNNESYEIIMVEDCSPDNSWEQMKNISASKKFHLKIFRLAKNYGQQKATLCGILQAKGRYVITIDDDLQIDPLEIGKLIQRMEETDAGMVYGVFEKKHHGIVRNLGSRVVNSFFKYFSSTYGNGSSFRLFRRNMLEGVMVFNRKYFLLDELLCSIAPHIAHTTVTHHVRGNGKSGYSIFKLIFMTLNYIINYTILPLRMMTYGGLLFSLISFFIGLYFIYKKLFDYVELGFTSIIVAIFFSASLMLFSLGIIGEYITRLYYKESSYPMFIIKEKIE